MQSAYLEQASSAVYSLFLNSGRSALQWRPLSGPVWCERAHHRRAGTLANRRRVEAETSQRHRHRFGRLRSPALRTEVRVRPQAPSSGGWTGQATGYLGVDGHVRPQAPLIVARQVRSEDLWK